MLVDALVLRGRILNDILKPTLGAVETSSALGTTAVATVASVAAATAAAAAAATSGDPGGWQQEGSAGKEEQPSTSLLVSVPCLEVLCFTDLSMEPAAADGVSYK
jgi:hypothetical protein